MCVPGCQEAVRAALTRRGFFKGAAAAGFAATAVAPAEAAPRARPRRAQFQGGGRSHPHHVAGLSDLLRRAGHRVAEAVRLQEGRLQSELVADHRACRHAPRCADPFLGERRHRGQDRRRRTGGAARRDRCAQAGARRIPIISSASRTSRLWEKKFRRLPDNCCVAMHVGLGAARRRSPPSSPARTPAARSTFPASRRRRPNGC